MVCKDLNDASTAIVNGKNYKTLGVVNLGEITN